MIELKTAPITTFSVLEASKAAQVTRKTIYRALDAGELVSINGHGKGKGALRIAADDLQSWIKSRKNPVGRKREQYRALSRYHAGLLTEAMTELAACSSAFLRAYEVLQSGDEELDDAQAFEDALQRDFADALKKFSFTAVSRIALHHAAKELAEAQDAAKNSNTKQKQDA